MDVRQEIEEIKALLDGQIEGVPENLLEEQYKSRNISNYAVALKTLLEIQKREEKSTWKED